MKESSAANELGRLKELYLRRAEHAEQLESRRRGPNWRQLAGALRLRGFKGRMFRVITRGTAHCQGCGQKLPPTAGIQYFHGECKRELKRLKRKMRRARGKAWRAGGRAAAEAAWRERDRQVRASEDVA